MKKIHIFIMLALISTSILTGCSSEQTGQTEQESGSVVTSRNELSNVGDDVDITIDNFDEYFEYGCVLMNGQEHWCYYLKNPEKYDTDQSSIYVNGSYEVVMNTTISNAETGEVYHTSAEIDHSRGMTFSDFWMSEEGNYVLALAPSDYNEVWDEYRVNDEFVKANCMVEYEVTSINVTKIGGYLVIKDTTK